MTGPADLGYTLLPADPGVLTPDLALEAALAPIPDLEPPGPAPIGRGWAFDCVAGEFVLHGATPQRIDGLDQIRMWIEKTLRTARFAHPIYTDVYGVVEPTELLGQPYDGEVLAAYQEAIVDALTVHDRIAAVDGFSFAHDPMDDALYVSFTVTLDAAAESQLLNVSSFPLVTS